MQNLVLNQQAYYLLKADHPESLEIAGDFLPNQCEDDGCWVWHITHTKSNECVNLVNSQRTVEEGGHRSVGHIL